MSENDLATFLLDIIMSSWVASEVGGVVNSFGAVVVFRRQNLTSVGVRFWSPHRKI